MSTYINQTDKNLRIDHLDAPLYLQEYLNYLLVIKNLSHKTVNSYYIQLRIFFRWLKCRDVGGNITKERLEKTVIGDIPFDFLERVETEDIYDYLSFTSSVLGNSVKSRALKLSAIKSLYYYFTITVHQITTDPVKDIATPKLEKVMPKFLTIDDAILLLESVDGDEKERDYCIITFFLNCGMRLSELTAINMNDIRGNTLRLFGKGRKERIVYLNSACCDSLKEYKKKRLTYPHANTEKALFISSRLGKRLSTRRVEQIVEETLQKAGLAGRGYSPHKLRHSAATHLYRSGAADILTLKTILGHEDIATTEIYTHLDEKQIKTAMEKAPLANFGKKVAEDEENNIS